MSLRIDFYFHSDQSNNTDAKLDAILAALTVITQQEKRMSNELDSLTTQVAANTTVEESAVTLLNGLSAQITALKNDPVALAALAASLKTSGDDLSAAIVANTPAA